MRAVCTNSKSKKICEFVLFQLAENSSKSLYCCLCLDTSRTFEPFAKGLFSWVEFEEALGVHPMQPQQQREDFLRREESRKEEQEKNRLESLLRDFDSLSFYGALERWEKAPIPQPVRHQVTVTLMRQKAMYYQPLPISRKELWDLRQISKDGARLLALLQAADQKGMDCPYIHQQNKHILELALEKCQKLKEAGDKYLDRRGFWARFCQFFNLLHMDAAKKDIDAFEDKLEAVLLMCRHQEFAQDLIKLRSVASDYRVRSTMVGQERPKTTQAANKQPPPRGGFRFGPPSPGDSF